MSRRFRSFSGAGGAKEFIQFAAGAAGAWTPGTMPNTFAILWRPASVQAGTLVQALDGTNGQRILTNNFSDGHIYHSVGGFQDDHTLGTSYDPAAGWEVWAQSSHGGPAAFTPRFHRYRLNVGSWVHAAAAGNLSDPVNPAITHFLLGGAALSNETGDFWAACAGWAGREFTDADFDNGLLNVGVTKWLSLFDIVWKFDQTDVTQTVLDLKGSGADQTGRQGTVVDLAENPPGFSYSTTIDVTPPPVTGVEMIIFELEQAMLTCAYNGVDHTGDLAINRTCVVPGAIAWDNCQCGQLVISENRRYPAKAFPLEDASDDDIGCQPWLVVDITMSLVRCVPVMDEDGNPPSCDVMNTAAAQLSKDMTDIRRAVECCLQNLYDQQEVATFQLGAQDVVGPEGGCGGAELSILIGIPNGCGCG